MRAPCLLLLLPAVAALRWDPACLPECVPQLAEYVTLHAALRRNATTAGSSVPRLTLWCPPEAAAQDAGLGDRTRAVLFGLRVAAHYRRLFVLDLAELQISDKLQPAVINWAPAGLGAPPPGAVVAHVGYPQLTELHTSTEELDYQLVVNLKATIKAVGATQRRSVRLLTAPPGPVGHQAVLHHVAGDPHGARGARLEPPPVR